MTHGSLVQFLRRWAAVVVLASLLPALASVAYDLRQPPTYAASTTLYFTPPATTDDQALNQGEQYTRRQMESYQQLVLSEDVLIGVIVALDLDTTPQKLADTLETEVADGNVLLTISTETTSPSRSVTVVNAVATRVQEVVSDLSPRRSDGTVFGTAIAVKSTVVGEAESAEQVFPVSWVQLVLAAAAPPVLVLLLLLLAYALDDRIRRRVDLAELSDVPVLGDIPARGRTSLLHARWERFCAAAESAAGASGVVLVADSSVHERGGALPRVLADTWIQQGRHVRFVDCRGPHAEKYVARVQSLRRRADVVVATVDPVLESLTAAHLARVADITVIVVVPGDTRRAQVATALTRLQGESSSPYMGFLLVARRHRSGARLRPRREVSPRIPMPRAPLPDRRGAEV